jgi:outer membrane biogenesis lipoprotein LolB
MNTKLSDKKIQALAPKEKPYRVNDDGGLSCFVTPNGKKHWRFRYQYLGKEQMLSMGEFPATSLALARKERDDARALLAENINPSKDRKDKLA